MTTSSDFSFGSIFSTQTSDGSGSAFHTPKRIPSPFGAPSTFGTLMTTPKNFSFLSASSTKNTAKEPFGFETDVPALESDATLFGVTNATVLLSQPSLQTAPSTTNKISQTAGEWRQNLPPLAVQKISSQRKRIGRQKKKQQKQLQMKCKSSSQCGKKTSIPSTYPEKLFRFGQPQLKVSGLSFGQPNQPQQPMQGCGFTTSASSSSPDLSRFDKESNDTRTKHQQEITHGMESLNGNTFELDKPQTKQQKQEKELTEVELESQCLDEVKRSLVFILEQESKFKELQQKLTKTENKLSQQEAEVERLKSELDVEKQKLQEVQGELTLLTQQHNLAVQEIKLQQSETSNKHQEEQCRKLNEQLCQESADNESLKLYNSPRASHEQLVEESSGSKTVQARNTDNENGGEDDQGESSSRSVWPPRCSQSTSKRTYEDVSGDEDVARSNRKKCQSE